MSQESYVLEITEFYLELLYKFNLKFMSNYKKRNYDYDYEYEYDYVSVKPFYYTKKFDNDIYSRMEAGYLLDDI
jgi:hypothetical protein